MTVTLHDDPRARIREGLMLLAGPAWQAGHIVELRAIDTPKGIVSGYFDREHLDEMVEAAWTWSGAEDEVKGEPRKTLGVYLTFNAVKRDCLARAANRVKTYAKHTTNAEDIERRYWLLIDCDPYTAVKNVSATEQEKERTKAAVVTVRDCLTAKGWPMPALGDTGNGHAAYYRIDLPADDGGLVLNQA